MKKDTKVKDLPKGSKGGAMAQPLDPTRSGEDFLGDTTGLTGVTTGSAQKTSRTPNDRIKDENKNHLPGGIAESNSNDDTGRRLTPELYDDEEYDRNLLQQMSQTRADMSEDIAEENETSNTSDTLKVKTRMSDPDEAPYTVNKQDASGDDSPGTDDINTLSSTYHVPEHLGEQSISGSAPDPTADDDTLEAAQAMGTQLGEDDEHPQELNIARDIDQAEEDLRNR